MASGMTMASGIRNVRINLSQQCFDLLADAMCDFSKKTGRFQTMRMTVQVACERLEDYRFSQAEFEQFLCEFPVDGEIGVWLEINPKWGSAYDGLRQKLKEFTGKQGIDKVMIPFAVYLATRHHLF